MRPIAFARHYRATPVNRRPPVELDGADLRPLPLGERNAKLARLLARKPAGMRLTAPYRSGPSRDWLKVKNPDSPAMRRAHAGLW